MLSMRLAFFVGVLYFLGRAKLAQSRYEGEAEGNS